MKNHFFNKIKSTGHFFVKNVVFLGSLFAVIVVILGIFICYNFAADLDKKNIETKKSEIEYVTNLIENQLSNYISISEYFASDHNTRFVILENAAKDIYIPKAKEMVNFLKNVVTTNSNIDSIYIFGENSKYVTTNLGTTFKKDFTDFSWKSEYEKMEPNASKIFCRQTSEQRTVISCVYKVMENNEIIGGIIINSDIDRCMEFAKDKDIVIFDDSDKTVFYSDNSNLDNSKITSILKHNKNGIIKESNKYYTVVKCNSVFGNFYYGMISEIEGHFYKKLIVYLEIAFLLGLCVLFFAFITLYFAKINYKPIREIGELIENPSSQNALKYLSNDENTKKIAEKIFTVISTNERLSNELNTKMEISSFAQLKALQWQINPHFIFNTLNTLYLMSDEVFGSNNKVCKGISSLSKLMRYTLKVEPMIVELSQEMSAVLEYIKIMKNRLGDTFDFNVSIDKSFMEKKVVKMCIQPVLENCFRYAIKDIEIRGIINVTAQENGNSFEIIISDNGSGIDPKKLNEIKASLLAEPKIGDIHIGFTNVNSKIVLLYGSDYGVNVESELNVGTTVTLKFPIE